MDPAELLAAQNEKLDAIIALLGQFVEQHGDATIALCTISNAMLMVVDREPAEPALPPANPAVRAVASKATNTA